MKTVTVPFVSHPCTSERRLYFLADPPHLLKNLWNCLLTHTLELDDDVVKKHSLPSRVIDAKYVKSLVDLQTGHSLRLANKLKKIPYQSNAIRKDAGVIGGTVSFAVNCRSIRNLRSKGATAC
jgi:hypothetical protein